MFEEGEEYESPNGFCAVASHVTAHARLLLYGYAEKAGFDEVYYMDTDSLFVTRQGRNRLEALGVLDGNRLGALKDEGSTSYLTLYTPKDYQGEGKTKRKGISKEAVQITHNTWEIIVWPKLATFIRANSMGQYYNIKQKKTLRRNYTKGTIKAGRVYPIRLGVNEEGKIFESE
jgi:hypothetical protein